MKDRKKNLYKAGSYVYIEGDEDVNEVYIVEKGLIEFKSFTEKIRSQGNVAKSGDIFGFISSLSSRPRMESAYARIDSVVIVFSRERFLNLLQKNSDIAVKLINSLADELRTYDNMIFPLEGRKDIFFPVELKLFNLGKYYYVIDVYKNSYYILLKYLELYPDGSFRNEARELLDDIESTGIRQVAEPIRDGIYRLYADKQVIFCENEPGDELFIIKKGKVKIVKFHNDSEVLLSVLGPGDIFGELAIVSDNPRNATAISYGNTTLLPINEHALMKLIEKSSDILKRIFTAISQRVWFTFIRIEAKIYDKALTRVYAFLENKLLEENISLKNREPYTFNFGIDELLKMTGITGESSGNAMQELLKDPNLGFHFGQTTIENPSLVASKARFYKSRDHLSDADSEPEEAEGRMKKIPLAEEVMAADPIDEFPEPPGDVEAAADAGSGGMEIVSSDLFDELDEEVPDIE